MHNNQFLGIEVEINN